ncbi:MAG: M1 family peptidase [Flavobacteriales bacterium]|nr:M1 family peptidase [Flavobacteriales bacterium]
MKNIFLITFCLISTAFYAQQEVYNPSATIKTRLQHTKLKVKPDFQKEQLYGEEWITASPYFYPTDSLTLDAKGMLIHDVALVKDGQNKNLKFDYKNDSIFILLDKKYKRSEEYTVYIKYTARPNEVKQQGSAAITQAKGLYFIDPRDEDPNKPTQVWTQGETESSSCWFPTIDKPNQKTSEEITITVPSKYTTLSNGKLISSKNNSDGTRSDYWKFDKKHAPYLFFMGIGEYSIIEDKWKDIPVNYYVEKEYEPYAKQIFGETPEMISFFSERLNYPFPWNKYSQIVCRDYVSGAMENTTAVVHAENAYQKSGQLVDENVWEDVIAHELFHHWFGDLVTTESWSNLTVNESFANYSEYLWREHRYGKDHAEEHKNEDIEGYLKGKNFDKHLVRFNFGNKEDVFDSVSYNKGGYILHMLRNYLGDDAFFTGLNLYLTQNQYKSAEAHNLRLALEEVSGKDLNWFFNQWYYSNGHPKLEIAYEIDEANKKAKVSIIQTQEPLFQFPFAIDVYENGTKKRHNVWIPKQKNYVVELPITTKPDLINVNADHVLLSEITDDKTVEQYIFQLKNAPEYMDRREAIDKVAMYHTAKDDALDALLLACNDKYYGLRKYAIEKLEPNYPKVKKKALETLKKIALNDEKTIVRSAALKAIQKADSDMADFKDIYVEGVKSKSDAVKSTSILALYKIDKLQAIEIVKNLNDKEIQSDSFVDNISEIIIKEKITEKMPVIAKEVPMFPYMSNRAKSMIFRQGFEWIFSTDSPEATQKAVDSFSQIYPQAKKYGSEAVVKSILEQGLELKKMLPVNESIKNQISIIEKALLEMN